MENEQPKISGRTSALDFAIHDLELKNHGSDYSHLVERLFIMYITYLSHYSIKWKKHLSVINRL